MMGEGDFAWSRDNAAADESDIGDGMVGIAKRTARGEALTGEGFAGGGIDTQDIEEFGFHEGREDGGNPFGDHGFTGTRWTEEEEIVATGGGDLDGAAGGSLSLDVGKIVFADSLWRIGAGGRFGPWEGVPTLQEGAGGIDTFRDIDGEIAGQGGLGGCLGWEEEAFALLGGGAGSEGEATADRAGFAGEAQFPGDQVVADFGGLQLFGGAEDADSDRQVIEGTLLTQVPRGEVNGSALERDLESGIGDSGPDPIRTFFDGGASHADDVGDGFP